MSSGHSPNARQMVYERDDWTCRSCGFRQTDGARRRVAVRGGGRYLTLDHIVPRSKGGRNAMSNLQVLCNVCNHEKADSLDPNDALPARIRRTKASRSKLLAGLHPGTRGQMLLHDSRCDAQFCMNTCPVYLDKGAFA